MKEDSVSNMDDAPGPSYESILSEAQSLDAVTQMLARMDSTLGVAFAEARQQFQSDAMVVPVLISHLAYLVREEKYDEAMVMLNEAARKHSDGSLLMFNMVVTMHHAVCRSYGLDSKDLPESWESEWPGLSQLTVMSLLFQDRQYEKAFEFWDELDGAIMGTILVELAILSAEAYEAVMGHPPSHDHVRVMFHETNLN